MDTDIKIAKQVIKSEIDGLSALDEWIGDNFIKAIDLVSSVKGRIVVSGMGKSGHIARKIASTLASTGTTALFVHPGEASHGDLGMISKDDAVILLSNSGETSELHSIINFCKRFSVPIIAIVRREESLLTKVSDVALVLPDIAEACVVDAPTTSTTMMLALGDAMAVVLLERRGFNKEKFNILHPGGKLGAALMKVENLAHKDDKMPLVAEELLMSDVLVEMTRKSLGCTGVINDKGDFVGVITDGDLRRHMSSNITSQTAKEVMTKNPIVISRDCISAEAISIMEAKSITSLFIVEDKKPVGIVHIHDLLRLKVV